MNVEYGLIGISELLKEKEQDGSYTFSGITVKNFNAIKESSGLEAALSELSNRIHHNLNLTDMEVCYKVFKANVIKDIRLEENRFGFEPEITAKISKKNIKIYEVGVKYFGRTYSDGKKITWRDGFSALRCIFYYNLFK